MAQTATSHLGQIHALLANKRYSVTDLNDSVLKIQELESGISLRAVLEGDILFLSLVCMTVPATQLTAPVLRKMLAADNGISTSHFQLYEAGNGNVSVTLNNFCKLLDCGPEDEDDILSCVSFLLADVVHAKQLIGADLHSA
jgi:DNA-binding Xre family transcriptional regulator